MHMVREASASAEVASQRATVPTVESLGRSFLLTLISAPPRVVTEASTVVKGSVVRVLRGEHAGKVARVDGAKWGGVSLATYPMRYRRRFSVRLESRLRSASDPSKPHLHPGVGDEVKVAGEWHSAVVERVDDDEVTVVSKYDGAKMQVSLTVDSAIEVLFEPVLRMGNGPLVPLDPKFAMLLSEEILRVWGELTTSE